LRQSSLTRRWYFLKKNLSSYKDFENEVSEWVWVSTIPKRRLSTENFVKFAHDRWKIENNGFHELVNQWHADHVYRHDPVAIEAFGPGIPQ
jgi:hypothetical protein